MAQRSCGDSAQLQRNYDVGDSRGNVGLKTDPWPFMRERRGPRHIFYYVRCLSSRLREVVTEGFIARMHDGHAKIVRNISDI
jgi:hypothetical protein